MMLEHTQVPGTFVLLKQQTGQLEQRFQCRLGVAGVPHSPLGTVAGECGKVVGAVCGPWLHPSFPQQPGVR